MNRSTIAKFSLRTGLLVAAALSEHRGGDAQTSTPFCRAPVAGIDSAFARTGFALPRRLDATSSLATLGGSHRWDHGDAIRQSPASPSRLTKIRCTPKPDRVTRLEEAPVSTLQPPLPLTRDTGASIRGLPALAAGSGRSGARAASWLGASSPPSHVSVVQADHWCDPLHRPATASGRAGADEPIRPSVSQVVIPVRIQQGNARFRTR